MTLIDLFKRLIEESHSNSYAVMPLEVVKNALLGVSSSGMPSLFVKSLENLSHKPSVRTSHVSLRLGNDFKVTKSGAQTEIERFDSIMCESNHGDDIQVFLAIIEGLLLHSGKSTLNRNSLISFFRSTSYLFSARPARDVNAQRQGLWGELFFMQSTRGFKFWMPSWHSEPSRKFDFSMGKKRVEIKTSVGTERSHIFSHRQVFPYEGEEIMISSILLREEDAGLSLRDLISNALGEVNKEDGYVKLMEAIRHSSMEETDERGPSYDEIEAGRSLSWYRSTDIPHFGVAEPAGVSQTRYKIDLTAAPILTNKEIDLFLDSMSENVYSLKKSEQVEFRGL